MTYVYVLVSGSDDLYYEQALMSVTTLRMHMPHANVIVLVDDKTEQSFQDPNRQALQALASIVPIPFNPDVPKVDRSRLIKTSIPSYVQDSFLYIDCDTIVCDDLSDIEDFPAKTAGVLDGHVHLADHVHRDMFLARDKKLGFHGTKALDGNINGGIILAKEGKESQELFRAWNDRWKYAAYQKHDKHDQPPLNEANYLTGMQMALLPGEWNCQPAHGGLAFLGKAKIIHYYSSEMQGKYYAPYYQLADRKLQERIKQAGRIPEDIMKMLGNPKFQFNPVHIVSDKRVVSIMQSPLLFTFAEMKMNHIHLFHFFEKQAAFVRKLGKAVLEKNH